MVSLQGGKKNSSPWETSCLTANTSADRMIVLTVIRVEQAVVVYVPTNAAKTAVRCAAPPVHALVAYACMGRKNTSVPYALPQQLLEWHTVQPAEK